jgi:pimeloyl-ACP methyl ester carboxylesterase
MAHGFAAVKAGGLEAFAERFRGEGFTAVVFDYRQWGGSSGVPREETSVPRQRQDYRTGIDWAVVDPDIDATRIFVWGTSFSGLHAVEIAATDARLRGAIAHNPLVDGLATMTIVPPSEFGAVANAAAFAGLEIIRPKDGSEWHNRVAARSLLGLAAHRPVRTAAEIGCPILLVVAEHGRIAPIARALRVAERASKAELFRSRGDHYDVYEGGEDYDRVINAEVEFLHRHAQAAAR